MPNSLSGQGGARPRSVALVGPYGSGKSTLFDALLTAAGGPARRPGEARGRGGGTGAQLGHCSFMGDRWAIFDCPGSVEFAHEACSALAVVDLAIVVCEPAPEKALAVAPLLRFLRNEDVPHLLFINKIDTLTGRVRDTLAALQLWSSRPLVLRQVPVRERDAITGYVDLASGRAYRYRKGEPSEVSTFPAHMVEQESEARFALLEKLADHDDALLEKVLEDVTPSCEEIYRDLHRDIAEGTVVPIMLGARERDSGVRRLWKALWH